MGKKVKIDRKKHYVEFQNVGKSFVGVRALNNVSFRADGGEICALLGENGAGKSTLLKILSGVQSQDKGKIIIDGEEVHFANPIDAIRKGVSVIYQELQLVPSLTVMENIYIGDLPSGKLGIVNFKDVKKDAQKLIDSFGLPIKADQKVSELSVAYQHMVEIIKAVRRDSSIIAFDEPTSSLSEAEIKVLFQIIRRLRDEGKVVLYVSHRLQEIFELSKKIVILKDGKYVKTLETEKSITNDLIRCMVGRDLGDIYCNLPRSDTYGGVILEVRHLNNKYLHDISFKLHAGEILGFAGLVGAGRTETVFSIFGADHLDSGEILVQGKPVSIRGPKSAIRNGIGLCPEDRKEQGLILQKSIRENISAAVLNKVSKNQIINKKKEVKLAVNTVKQFNVKTHSIEKKVVELSGGNQQKVILGRWLASDPKILILDEPTKGIDVGAKSEIYTMVCNLARNGMGVIFISSELIEVINVCDNIIIMKEGSISGLLSRGECNEEKVLSLAMVNKQ